MIAQIKHFPGDGAAEGGRESHQAFGMYNIYPGEGFALQTVPFFDGAFNLGTKTETAMAVMPSYSIAWGEDEEYGELVGSNFSEYKINLLRDNGFDGIISTDSLIMPDNPMNIPTVSVHGMDGMNIQEVVTHMIKIGIDRILMPDFGEPVSFPEMIINAYNEIAEEEGVEAAEKNFRDSAVRLLRAYFLTGVFENPYAEKKAAVALIEDSGLTSSFNEANQKSIVMLKNNDVIKPAADGEKLTVYIAMEFSAGGKKAPAGWSLPIDEALASQYFNLVTDTLAAPSGPDGAYTENDIIRATDEQLAACDMVLVFMSNPSTGSGYDDATGTYLPISLQYNEYTADGEFVREESVSQGIVKTVVETPYGPTTSSSREDRSYYGESTVASNLSDLTNVLDLAARLPESCKIVTCINASNAMIFSEFEAEVDAILIGFAITDSNFLPVVAGQVEPYGLLPIQMPKDMDAVEKQLEDLPRDMEVYVDANGNAYDFAFGMNWSGVINDERVAKYTVPVVTTPENAVIELDY